MRLSVLRKRIRPNFSNSEGQSRRRASAMTMIAAVRPASRWSRKDAWRKTSTPTISGATWTLQGKACVWKMLLVLRSKSPLFAQQVLTCKLWWCWPDQRLSYVGVTGRADVPPRGCFKTERTGRTQPIRSSCRPNIGQSRSTHRRFVTPGSFLRHHRQKLESLFKMLELSESNMLHSLMKHLTHPS